MDETTAKLIGLVLDSGDEKLLADMLGDMGTLVDAESAKHGLAVRHGRKLVIALGKHLEAQE